MEMLDSDPERGLRHALPLDGPLGRGRSAPGAKLSARDTRFDLARVGGGGGRDHWDVPAEIRRRLLTRYRVLALREQRLGRFQRAAYIHAELLGDLSAAATVLKEGRFFAEAAALYRDHLHQTRAAAECFVAGGFFTEAIAIFEKERAFLELGDLHRRLENEPAAEIAFREAVEVKVGALRLAATAPTQAGLKPTRRPGLAAQVPAPVRLDRRCGEALRPLFHRGGAAKERAASDAGRLGW
jgi:hypothetical protein